MKNKAGWEITDEHSYEKFPIFEIKKSTRINPRTGKPFGFFLINGLDWANVVALTPKNEVVLVRQYRHGIEDFTLEIPGGCVEQNEDPKDAVLRELREETGYTTESIEPLGVIAPNPAMMSNRCHLFLARGARSTTTPQLDPGEDIRTELRSLEETLRLVDNGTISHALVVAAFGLLRMKDFLL